MLQQSHVASQVAPLIRSKVALVAFDRLLSTDCDDDNRDGGGDTNWWRLSLM